MIIPIRVQEGYRPSGWLDLMAGGLLYIDFTKYDFLTAYMQLCQQSQQKVLHMGLTSVTSHVSHTSKWLQTHVQVVLSMLIR